MNDTQTADPRHTKSVEVEAPRLQLGQTAPVAGSNRCPKCDAIQWNTAATCHECGLVFQKWLELQARKARQTEEAKRKHAARPVRLKVSRSGVGLSLSRGVLHGFTFAVGALCMLVGINFVLGSGSLLDLGLLLPPTQPHVVDVLAAEAGTGVGLETPVVERRNPHDRDFQLVLLESSAAEDGGERARVVFSNLTGTTIRDLKVQGVGVDRRGHTIYTVAVPVEQILGPMKTLEATLVVPAGVELTSFRIGHWRQGLGQVVLNAGRVPEPAT